MDGSRQLFDREKVVRTCLRMGANRNIAYEIVREVEHQLYDGMTTEERDSAWKERAKFYELAAIVKYEAKKLNVNVRWGGDWDGDGDYTDQTFDDLVHFEFF